MPEPGHDLGGWQRRAEQEALEPVAAGAAQAVGLQFALDADRCDLEAQAVRERDDRAHDRGRFGVGADLLDEAAVDLELVRPQAPERAQPGMAGAEVVDRELDPQLP